MLITSIFSTKYTLKKELILTYRSEYKIYQTPKHNIASRKNSFYKCRKYSLGKHTFSRCEQSKYNRQQSIIWQTQKTKFNRQKNSSIL